MQPSRPSSLLRPFHMLLFLGGCVWVLVSRDVAVRAADGLSIRYNLSLFDDLIQQAFLLFFLLWGFATLRWIFSHSAAPFGNSQITSIREVNALPKRATSKEEWLRGAAVGWGMALAALLPMVLIGSLHPEFNFSLNNLGLMLVSLATLAVLTLTFEVTFRGFLFAEFLQATSPVFATIFFSFFIAAVGVFSPDATLLSFLNEFLFGILLSICYLRTRALWIGWGLHFAWSAVLAALFGLPLAGEGNYSNLVFTSVSGPQWVTGGPYGPDAALLTVAVLLLSIVVVLRVTRNYAWEYTYVAPLPGGYPMEPAPAAGHEAAPAPLVQILGSTPAKPVASSTDASSHPEVPSSQP
ncbi:MAG: CPBP family intramembrane glutamic endopeptidase [Acidobacteriaceae bacterium]